MPISERNALAELRSRLQEALNPFPREAPALIGVSGGCDSMVLLDLLLDAGFADLTVCHLDHGLRGSQSGEDARFVTRASWARGVRVLSARARTTDYAIARSLSLELAARELRYAFFADCAKRVSAKVLLLAHHADDQIETCLWNFLRGSGAAGLAGMRPLSEREIGGIRLAIARPLLCIRRTELQEYAAARGIEYRDDSSNMSLGPTRNRLRHVLLPAAETLLGREVGEAILRASRILGAEEDWMSAAAAAFPIGEQLPAGKLLNAPLALRRRIVMRWLHERGVIEPGFDDVEAVLSIAHPSARTAKVNLPRGMHCRRRRGFLFVENT